MTTREMLEAALVAEPENLALHSAYADLLIEEGDPRGEYIRLELMLKQRWLKKQQRKQMQLRKDELMLREYPNWLGPLFQYCDAPIGDEGLTPEGRVPAIQLRWKRGWICGVEARSADVTLLSLLAKNPLIRLNRSLDVCACYNLAPSPGQIDLSLWFEVVKSIPFTRLVLQYFETVGDRLVEELLASNILPRISSLVLHACELTDDGATMLANSPHIRRLKSLNLDNNHLTAIGVAALAEVGFTVEERRFNPGWGEDGD